MSYGEALRLAALLARDPSSQVAAALNKWDAPRSREWLIAADTYDLLTAANTDRRHRSRLKPYPRPWPDENTKRLGRTSLLPEKVRALLSRRGPTTDKEA